MNLVRPSENFVRALRSLTAKHGAVLIYDEVMTGFRVALGGAQSLHGITPDLTTMGKVIGGGMPLAASAGAKTSWPASPRWAACIRRVLCRATPWPWRPD